MFPHCKAGGEGRRGFRASAAFPAAAFNPLRAALAFAPSLAGIHVSTAIAAGLLGLALLIH